MGHKPLEELEDPDKTENAEDSTLSVKSPTNEERVGNEIPQESFADNSTDTDTVAEECSDVANKTDAREKNEENFIRAHSFELTQSVV